MEDKAACQCNERNKPVTERNWSVGRVYANGYSDVICGACGVMWQAKARYINYLPKATTDSLARDRKLRGAP